MSHPDVGCALVGPRDLAELENLLDTSEPFRHVVRSLAPPAVSIPERLLDPSQW
jgi:hypothetical protein